MTSSKEAEKDIRELMGIPDNYKGAVPSGRCFSKAVLSRSYEPYEKAKKAAYT